MSSAELRKIHRELMEGAEGDIEGDHALSLVLKDIVSWSPKAILEHFSSRSGGFLTETEASVFADLAKRLRLIDGLVPAMALGKLGSDDFNDVLKQLFIESRWGAKGAECRDDYEAFESDFSHRFGLIIRHLLVSKSRRIYLDRLSWLGLYFKHGAFEEDVASLPKMAKAFAELQSEDVGSPEGRKAGKALAKMVWARMIDRSIAIQTHIHTDEDYKEFGDGSRKTGAIYRELVGSESPWNTARLPLPIGWIERILKVPNGFVIGFGSRTGIDMFGNEYTSPARRLDDLVEAIELGQCQSIRSLDEISAIILTIRATWSDLYTAESLFSDFDEMMAEASTAGIHIEAQEALAVVHPLLATGKPSTAALAAKLSVQGLLCTSYPAGSFAQGKAIDILLDEYDAMQRDDEAHHRALYRASPAVSRLGFFFQDNCKACWGMNGTQVNRAIDVLTTMEASSKWGMRPQYQFKTALHFLREAEENG